MTLQHLNFNINPIKLDVIDDKFYRIFVNNYRIIYHWNTILKGFLEETKNEIW